MRQWNSVFPIVFLQFKELHAEVTLARFMLKNVASVSSENVTSEILRNGEVTWP